MCKKRKQKHRKKRKISENLVVYIYIEYIQKMWYSFHEILFLTKQKLLKEKTKAYIFKKNLLLRKDLIEVFFEKKF